jgi:hypothetical protein
MSDSQYQATSPAELERQIMSHSEAKNEREWWACREIERLRARIAELDGMHTRNVEFIKRISEPETSATLNGAS